MFSWLQKDIPVGASALFRGTWPCTKENFNHLRDRGIELSDRETPENGIWALKLRHPDWGEAVLMCLRDLPMPPEQLIDWDAYLTDDEKAEVKACGTAVSLMVTSRRNHLLRDRKNALCFMEAVLGEEGVAAVDHLSGRIWSRQALRTETSHKADADVQSLFTIHYVVGEAPKRDPNDELEEPVKTAWLHTHGLSEIGLFDFDILNPSNSITSSNLEAVRAVAFALLEGTLKPGGKIDLLSTAGPIWAVPAKEFMAKAAPEWKLIRDDPAGEHFDQRVVLCEIAQARFFGRVPTQVRPSKSLQDDLPEGCMIHFSTEATTLMAERARATYPVFRQLFEEFKNLELPCLVKIGYTVDKGGNDEHLWFQVHEARENEVDATLLNQPFDIKRLKEGDCATHPIERLSDWQIMAGPRAVNPRDMSFLSTLRTLKK